MRNLGPSPKLKRLYWTSFDSGVSVNWSQATARVTRICRSHNRPNPAGVTRTSPSPRPAGRRVGASDGRSPAVAPLA
jgi:hypothetical protein